MARVIGTDEVKQRIDAGSAVVLEALPPSYYAQAHLPGALNLPLDDLDGRAAEVIPTKDTEVIVYCSDDTCGNSGIAADRLAELGYTNVLKYAAGKRDWVDAGLPTESADQGATRVVGGVELPAAGVWRIDPGHAEVGFVGRHFMLTKVRGRFTGVEGAVTVGERPEDSAVTVTIDMTSVASGDQTRDDHLRSADFFDVAAHPGATFTSTSVSWTGSGGVLDGDLTIKGVTHPVSLAVDHLGVVRDPWGNDRAVFSAKGRINREDWGLTWNMVLEAGGILVSKEIDLELEVELIRETA
ncbi:polyisoprenoid-binding protein YceI/rhodanese-related sulfurtransferase [Actinokineospora baliensis]|uniref:YceI family protein n=1 Tax=Actinokineospora baliensis TaxID=547056 RepID=UPI001EF8A359|nr:YceI family protein [Actinokineospora baliensis]MBM7776099.1 polyisoprenoid-binding protein YceI/rhodanese-related sulfurtransferase [Actinokineospora baliensis]